MKKLSFVFVLFFFLLIGCKENYDPVLSFEEEDIKIEVGSEHVLRPIVKNSRGVILEGYDITYEMSNDEIVNIEVENNKVTVKALKIGKVDIIAKVKDYPNVTFTVKIEVEKVKIKNLLIIGDDSVYVGKTISLVPMTNPVYASLEGIIWESDNDSIATINNGVLEAKAEGECIITAKIDDIVATHKVTVKKEKVFISKIEIVNEDNTKVKVKETLKLDLNVDPSINDDKIIYSSDNDSIATVTEDGTINALSVGKCNIIVSSLANASVYDRITIEVYEDTLVQDLIITVKDEIEVDEEANIEVTVYPDHATNNDYTIISSDNTIAIVEGNVIKGVSVGECEIIVKSNDLACEKKVNVKVIAKKILVEKIEIDSKTTYNFGEELDFTIKISPENAFDKTYYWISSDEEIIEINENKLTVKKIGKVTLYAKANDKGGAIGMIEIEIIDDTEAPQIYMEESFEKDASVNYNTSFDPLKGVKAVDNFDGDVTSKIKVEGTINNRKLGEYKYTYTVSDKKGNKATFERNIKVIWDYAVKFIGHAGCYSGLMNSEQAFLNAFVKHGYQGIECDLKQTKDGVFVMSHDDTFNKIDINQKNWSELENVTYTAERGGISYTTKLCTLTRYLQICKQYNGFAVIELKYSSGINNSDQSRMQALMNEIEKAGMLNNVVFLGSQYNCLIWTRNNGYEYIPCQYLVNSCESQTVLDRCIDNNLDLSFNVTYSNSDEWIARFKEAGLKVACYTFSQYTNAADLQKWIDKGVDYVTVDVTKPYEVNLPLKQELSGNKYKVTFKDYDGKVLKETEVYEGKKAITPVDPTRDGYKFTGWDKDLNNILEALEVNATYEIINYTIKFDKNSADITESTWPSKEVFVSDFYTDLFNWFKDNIDNISYLTKSGDEYVLTKNSVTVKWKTVDDIRKLDIYNFEKTIANFCYKPFVRTVNEAVDPQIDNNYFLNTEPYRTKYKGMDGYLLNSINVRYTDYDKGYKLTDSGKVQIFFRFHQWAKGTTIASLDNYPVKYEKGSGVEVTGVVLPNDVVYTINDSVTLLDATSSNATFLGWYMERECLNKVDSIEVGTFTNMTLFAKWEK